MTLYLIRHGMTEANEQHLYCGSTDLPLSSAGAAQLRTLSYDLPTVRFLTSGMKRTNETLWLLFGNVPFEEDPRFRELDFGRFELRGYEELKEDASYQVWITGNNEANLPPDGESGLQMWERVRKALEEVISLGEDTAIITHGGVIAAIMAHLFPKEGKHRYEWQPKPGFGYKINKQLYDSIP